MPLRYLAEVRQPELGWAELEGLATRARASAAALRQEGTPVRFVRSIFVPEDDTCFFLFEAPSEEAVTEAGRRAALGIEVVTRMAATARTAE